MSNTIETLRSNGERVLFRTIGGELHIIRAVELFGDVAYKVKPVDGGRWEESGGWHMLMGSDVRRIHGAALADDLRASVAACYCDALTHCDYCRGLRSPSFAHSVRTNEVAHRRDLLEVA